MFVIRSGFPLLIAPGFFLLAGVAACSSDGTSASASASASTSTSASSSGSGEGGAGSTSSGMASSSGGSSATGTGGSVGVGGGGGAGAGASQDEGTFFPAGAVWYKDVSNDPVAADSAAITAWMEGFKPPNGWGTGTMKVDFSIVTVDVPAGTPKRTYTKALDYYYTPDCDDAPVPVPQGGAVEETYGTPTDFSGPFTGYNCGGFNDGADCHMLFLSRSENRLYEIYHATIDGTDTFHAGCLAIWDISKVYDVNGRGQQCTSADAAGFPIAPLLFTADEIKAGAINHAIRFILPNNMVRNKKYVSPATHGTATTGPATSIPYGARLRLRKDYPLNTLSPAAQVVAKALQKYGMLHGDGGNIALTAQSDLLSDVKWADVGFEASSLSDLKSTDFEVLNYGVPFDVTYDCQRTPITQ